MAVVQAYAASSFMFLTQRGINFVSGIHRRRLVVDFYAGQMTLTTNYIAKESIISVEDKTVTA